MMSHDSADGGLTAVCYFFPQQLFVQVLVAALQQGPSQTPA